MPHGRNTMGTPFPSRSPSLGNPVFRHDETSRASCRCLTHHLHESSLLPIPYRESAQDGYLISSTERPCPQAFFQGMCCAGYLGHLFRKNGETCAKTIGLPSCLAITKRRVCKKLRTSKPLLSEHRGRYLDN